MDLQYSRHLATRKHNNISSKVTMEMEVVNGFVDTLPGKWYSKSCILIVGDTGLGKSTLLNLFTGNNVPAGHSAKGVTSKNKIYKDLTHKGYPQWMDTVGLNEASEGQDPFSVCQSYLKKLREKSISCIHAIIWVSCLA